MLTLTQLVAAFQLRRLAKRSLVMTLIDFSYLFIITESVCYYVNSEKLKLFLQKEKSKRQENQLKEVLAKVPTGVMVFDENDNVLMKNKEAENIVKSFH